MTAPKHPPRPAPAGDPENTTSSTRPAGVSGKRPSADGSVMEQILQELSLQNKAAQEPIGPHAPPPGDAARDDAAKSDAPKGEGAADEAPGSGERPSGDYRAPEGAQSASAYVPPLTIQRRPPKKVETVTVQVDDPRRWPTVRLPREIRPAPSETARSGRAPRGGPAEDTAPTLRSSINATPPPRRAVVRWWAIGVVIAAVASAILVALVSHIWSSDPPKDAPQTSSSQTP